MLGCQPIHGFFLFYSVIHVVMELLKHKDMFTFIISDILPGMRILNNFLVVNIFHIVIELKSWCIS